MWLDLLVKPLVVGPGLILFNESLFGAHFLWRYAVLSLYTVQRSLSQLGIPDFGNSPREVFTPSEE